MMRLWVKSHAVRVTLLGAAVASVLFHAATITAWVLGTMPQPDVEQGSIANHVFYIPAPDRAIGQPGSVERMRYVQAKDAGQGIGDGARMMGEARPTSIDQSVGRENTVATDSMTSHALPETKGNDTVFSVLDVDTAVVRAASSAAPADPLKLLEQHVQGFVNAKYVVDTTGFADTTTFEVLQSTNKEFVQAVKDALPYMRFSPAKIGPEKVRQLVQQQFSFKITDTSVTKPKKP
jgi:hypothetical protein